MPITLIDANNYLRIKLFQGDLSVRSEHSQASASQIWVWDGKNNNERRRKLFPGYKIRDYTGQEDVFAFLDLMKEALLHTDAHQVEVPNWEADDVIATLTRHFVNKGEEVVIQSNDLDYSQLLVHPGVQIPLVRIPQGISVKDIPLYKALVGDSSDKIPGLPGMGIKSFQALEPFYDDIRAILKTDGELDDLLNIPWKKSHKLFLTDPDNRKLIRTFYMIVQLYEVPFEEIIIYSGKADQKQADELFQRYMM